MVAKAECKLTDWLFQKNVSRNIVVSKMGLNLMRISRIIPFNVFFFFPHLLGNTVKWSLYVPN